MLVNLNGVLLQAQKAHYGVGLFNTVNPEMAQGVLAAMLLPKAREAKVPVRGAF